MNSLEHVASDLVEVLDWSHIERNYLLLILEITNFAHNSHICCVSVKFRPLVS